MICAKKENNWARKQRYFEKAEKNQHKNNIKQS